MAAHQPSPSGLGQRRHSAPPRCGDLPAVATGLSGAEAELVSLRAQLAEAERRRRKAEALAAHLRESALREEIASPAAVLTVELGAGGEPLRIPARPQTETVGQLKSRIEERSGIPSNQLALYAGTTELHEDSWPLSACGVVPGAWLRASRARPLRFTVRINPFTAVRVVAYPEQRVLHVKQMVDKHANVPPRLQCLLLRGKELCDQATLRQSGIESGVELGLRRPDARGGARQRPAPPPPPPPPQPTLPPPGRSGALQPQRKQELEEVVDVMTQGVTDLCEQQVTLQRTVKDLVTALDKSAVARAPARPPLATADLLTRSRVLRAEADAEAGAKARLSQEYRSPVSAIDPVPAGSAGRAELARRLQQEVARFADTEDAAAELRKRLLSAERHRDQYFLIRLQMEQELNPMPQAAGPPAGGKVTEPAAAAKGGGTGKEAEKDKGKAPAPAPAPAPAAAAAPKAAAARKAADSDDEFVPPDDPSLVVYN